MKPPAWYRSFMPQRPLALRVQEAVTGVADTLPPLIDFGQKSDQEFVAIAQGLASLQNVISDLQNQAQEISQNLSRKTDDNVFSTTFTVGKQAIELVHSSIGMEYALQEQFEALEALMLSSEKIQKEFHQNRVVFRSLSVGFGMEAARCDAEHQAVFKTVASDFQRIDTTIENTIKGSFEEIGILLSQLKKFRAKWLESIGGSHDSLDQRLAKIRDDIYKIELDLEPCSQSSEAFSAAVGALSQSLIPIMVSLQSQDITRQRLEHVVSAFDKLAHPDVQKLPKKQRIAETLLTAKLQQKQLSETRSLISDSSSQALSGINSSLIESELVAKQLQSLQRELNNRFGDSKVAYTFIENIDAISKITHATQTVHEEISNLDEQIRTIIDRFNSEIAEQQHDIRLIALNAQVAAARLQEGGALECLAKETAIVATANQKTSNGLAVALDEALSKLSQARELSIAQVAALESERKDLEVSTQDIDTKLIAFITSTIEKSNSMQIKTAESKSGIVQLLEGLTFPKRIESDLGPAQQALDELVGICQEKKGGQKLSNQTIERLRQDADQYTMQSERELHMQACAEIASASGDLELF